MEIQTLKIEIEGIEDMLMHNGRLANPLDEYTKVLKGLTSDKKKTDAKHLAIAKAEYIGGLYWDPELGVYVSGEALESCLLEGAKKNKLGKAFKSAVFVTGDFSLTFGEKKKLTPDELWASGKYKDTRGCVVSQKRIMRTRPRFPRGWKLSFNVTLMPDAGINPAEVKEAATNAGMFCGLGDYRPRYGRFKVTKFE